MQNLTNSSTLMYKDGKEVVGLLDARLSAAELSIDADPEVSALSSVPETLLEPAYRCTSSRVLFE